MCYIFNVSFVIDAYTPSRKEIFLRMIESHYYYNKIIAHLNEKINKVD